MDDDDNVLGWVTHVETPSDETTDDKYKHSLGSVNIWRKKKKNLLFVFLDKWKYFFLSLPEMGEIIFIQSSFLCI